MVRFDKVAPLSVATELDEIVVGVGACSMESKDKEFEAAVRPCCWIITAKIDVLILF
jgi:hypothetical protein